jgi:YbbR domain-containing protein
MKKSDNEIDTFGMRPYQIRVEKMTMSYYEVVAFNEQEALEKLLEIGLDNPINVEDLDPEFEVERIYD